MRFCLVPTGTTTALCVMGVVQRLIYRPINESSVAALADKPEQFASIEYGVSIGLPFNPANSSSRERKRERDKLDHRQLGQKY